MKLKNVLGISVVVLIGFLITNVENFKYSENNGLMYSPKADCSSPKNTEEIVSCSDLFCMAELERRGYENTGYAAFRKSHGFSSDPSRIEVFFRSSAEKQVLICVLKNEEVVSIEKVAPKI